MTGHAGVQVRETVYTSPIGIRRSEHLDGAGGADGAVVFGRACVMGLEGIVAKRRDRPYKSGRSPGWTKVKNPDVEVAGFTGAAPEPQSWLRLR